eukprot:9785952-Karenia_brevis.AAC.1
MESHCGQILLSGIMDPDPHSRQVILILGPACLRSIFVFDRSAIPCTSCGGGRARDLGEGTG